MKNHLLTLLAAFATLVASAQAKVEIDGIWYNLDTSAKEAEVTHQGEDSWNNEKYSGSVAIPTTVAYNGVTYSVTSIGGDAFLGCSSLTAITIPESVKEIRDEAFRGCSSLTAITIPEGVKAIGYRAFRDCTSLTTINIPESIVWARAIFGYTFYGCTSLTNVTIPEGVLRIESSAFEKCSSLTSIILPESMKEIGNFAFSGCTSLTSIILPESMKKIRSLVFSGCSSLTSINIPEGVTSIGYDAFSDCNSLTSIILPESMEEIGNRAFSGCTSLTSIICNAVTPPTIESTLISYDADKSIPVYVPASSVKAYKAAKYWSEFTNIRPLATSVTLNQSSVSLIEGESITLSATVIPEAVDVASVIWSSSDEDVAIVSSNGKVDAIGVGSATITATANDGSGVSASCEVTVIPTIYTITYLVDGIVHHQDTQSQGSAIEPIESPTKEGYTFSGWSEVPKVMPNDNVTITGTFTVNNYTVTFKLGDEVIYSESLPYGSEITAPEVSEKEGHTFSGWGEVAATVPAKDVTYEGSYTVNNYTVTFKLGDEIIYSESLPYGSEITAPEVSEKEGHTFSGWGEVAATVPAKDVTYEGTPASEAPRAPQEISDCHDSRQ